MRVLVFVVLLVTTARADVCKKLDVTVPSQFDNHTRHDVAVPDIVDHGDHQLDAFFDKLARVARTGGLVRIGIYGDSNWTNDRTAGEIRRRLQLAFGDGGHGFVGFGLPWGWYHHQNVQHGMTGRWSSWNPSAQEVGDRIYGFAGMSAESAQAGATVWVETAKAGDPVGTAVTTFDMSYLARPKGGTFEVLIDGQSKEVVDSENATSEMKFLRYRVTDGAHRLTVKVKKGSVRLFGVALERDAGVIVDGIGGNAFNPTYFARMNSASMSAGLAHRNYDLLIEATGTKVWYPKKQPQLMPDLVALWRAALPNASFMLWSPPDFVAMKRPPPPVSEPYMGLFAKLKLEMAKTHKLAFWDQFAALGGSGSAPKFHVEGWDEADGVHIGPKLSAYIGERFVHALLADLVRRAEADPKLGCH